ncbi:hypothetical protein B4153_3889 [Bacillus cereus]|uniref:Uncharacterized protein n=1 Tax=Bacillus cereus (strain AH187) TaxID=405534 RepID=B7HKV0_BACC7|nr:hypothetical protein BCAH187_A3795 [Bacillus cereus AH187]ACP16629.1 hypothetical protein BAMEG_0752 [Bacillus anthracis str. CDC 684]ACQ49669.1 hypothetical protein BAA_3904 [Bacillus anthracis str. A0248]AEW56841.1 Hypothetical protein bcf_18600 [Bacillus cereus F837/76]EDR17398.1 hypothetical protein BAC_3886 [Bacillus anthracis str. A0488]EDR87634.1 hypothetical protein BAQ_3915 [Bacillus anthracis str. A0193]EDR91340.1 hypothetical protein BAH_3939 [Bacillus anthracis str. A0442]EDS9
MKSCKAQKKKEETGSSSFFLYVFALMVITNTFFEKSRK